MDAKEFRREVASRSVPLEELVERLLGRLEWLEKRVGTLEAENTRLKERLAQYEPLQGENAVSDETRDVNYSTAAEEKRRRRKRRKKSSGRRPTAIKFEQATVVEDLRPKGVPKDCQRLLRKRVVWRLRDHKAVLVGYRVFGAPGVAEPRIPAVLPRGEYGLEIVVVLAFLVYVIRMSQDKACYLLRFFCDLPISRSQVDSLLSQLGRHWDGEFQVLCDLLVRAAVVYMDETGWKIGKMGCSLWAFATDAERVFLFGCRKDAATLDAILPPDMFQGIGVSDDAAYANRETRGKQRTIAEARANRQKIDWAAYAPATPCATCSAAATPIQWSLTSYNPSTSRIE